MSRDVRGRDAATSHPRHARTYGTGATDVDAPTEVLEFIRYCYLRRGFGWPELYDEMCAVAARGGYRGMDYDGLARLGIGFGLGALPRLVALADRIVAEERAARKRDARPVDARPDEFPRADALGAGALLAAPAG